MTEVYLSLGSNVGNRKGFLSSALQSLDVLPLTRVIAVSSIYETVAWGNTNQSDFLNLCCQLETELQVQDLLRKCQHIEKQLKRKRSKENWGPRTIDIDILLFGSRFIQMQNLQIPHPYMTHRAFVLAPLSDIAGEVIHPSKNQSILQLLSQVDCLGVKKSGIII